MSVKPPTYQTIARFNDQVIHMDTNFYDGFIYDEKHYIGLIWFNTDTPLMNAIKKALNRDPDYIAGNMHPLLPIEFGMTVDEKNDLITLGKTPYVTHNIFDALVTLSDREVRFYLLRETGHFYSPLLIVNSLGEGIVITPYRLPVGSEFNPPEWGCSKCGYISVDDEPCLCE